MLRPLASFLLAAAAAAPALADTRIRIEGTRRKSEAQVLELVGDRLEHIRANPPPPPAPKTPPSWSPKSSAAMATPMSRSLPA